MIPQALSAIFLALVVLLAFGCLANALWGLYTDARHRRDIARRTRIRKSLYR